MASIQSSPHPLVFRLEDGNALGFGVPSADGLAIRSHVRALEGMQKEAVVGYGPTGTLWRMVSDEGPYLNGTDLAPFPLAFFTAGLAASYMSEIQRALRQRKLAYRGIRITQENRYTMSGSALKGTMTGGALPVELAVEIDTDAGHETLREAVACAIAASPATGLLQERLESEFTLTVNGERVATGRVVPLGSAPENAAGDFDGATPSRAHGFAPEIIEKLTSAEAVFGVEGGAGSSLASEQSRTLHVRGMCSLREDGLKEIRTQLLKPLGSTFRFLSDDARDDGGSERAPSGLAYLSAGIAFCYMTQLGRYAHIVKKPLERYRIVQDTRFSVAGGSCKADPVRTHVFIDTPEGADYGRKLVDMGEQTCFLHAACRSEVERSFEVTGVDS